MRLREDLTLRSLGGEYIIVDPGQDVVDMSKVFTLNETAAFLWKELQGIDFTVDTVVDLLVENFEVDEAIARQDASLLLSRFAEQKLLKQ